MSPNSSLPPLLGYFLPKGGVISGTDRTHKPDDRLSWTRNIHAGMAEHITTIAPTGAGKGTACIIPNLLRETGPAIVIDPKGENYLVTARARREMGHRVVVLDPFGLIESFSPGTVADSFNPMDILRIDDDLLEEDAIAMANLLVKGHAQIDPLWNQTACNLITGLLVYLRTQMPKPLQTLHQLHRLIGNGPNGLRQTFTSTELSKQTPFVQNMIGAVVHAKNKIRSPIQTVALSHSATFASNMMARAMAPTSFELEDFIAGKPMTIYIVFPPEKMRSHSVALRLWLASLLQLITRCRHVPEKITTLFADDAGQLGSLEELRMAATHLRGHGLRLWTFWQDLSQIKTLYPQDWQTMLNNAGTIQVFGNNHGLAQRDIASLVDLFDEEIFYAMSPDQQILLRRNGRKLTARKLNYRIDPDFAGLFDDNPLYASQTPAPTKHPLRSQTASANTAELPQLPSLFDQSDRLER